MLLCLTVCLAAHLAFTPMYRQNDDTGMDMLVRGVGFASEPTPFLLFSNWLYGVVLTSLHGLAPGIPWYRLAGAGIQLVATLILGQVILARRFSATRVALFFVYLLGFDLVFWVHPQFTILAAIPAQAAILLWLDRSWNDEPLGAGGYATFLALLVASALVRFQTCVLMLVIASPCFALTAWRSWRSRSVGHGTASTTKALLLRAAAPWILGVLLVTGVHGLDRLVYATDEDWQDFHRIHGQISEYVDFSRARFDAERAEVFAEVGWSRNDFDMLMNWFYADEQRYSIDRMQRVLDAFPRHRLRPVEEWVQYLGEARRDVYLLPMLVAALLPWAFVARGKMRWSLLLASLGTVLLLSAYLVVFLNRFPPRVYYPMLSFVALLATYLASIDYSLEFTRSRVWAQTLCAGLLALLTPGIVLQLDADSRLARQRNASLEVAMQQLDPRPDQLFVIWGASFPYEWMRPTDDLAELRDFKIFSLGADTRSPLNEARLREFEIDELARGIYERDGVLVIGDRRRAALLVEYVREHHGERIVPRLQGRYGSVDLPLFEVYRFDRIRPRRLESRGAAARGGSGTVPEGSRLVGNQ